MKTRQVLKAFKPQPVREGAGVNLIRSIATRELDYVDPFLLFDHFGSDNPEDYLAGFPMHPHRGIETVTYMLAGEVHHRDSLGNAGIITAGDIQWMTAGRGILHEEMPKPRQNKMEGFQLWVNLPARLKMTEPRYQEIKSSEVPVVRREDGVEIRVVAGQSSGVRGAVTEIAADPLYLDVTVPAQGAYVQHVEEGHAAVAYVFDGQGRFGEGDVYTKSPTLLVFDDGDQIEVHAGDQPVRFLLMAGKPLHEPVARYGPFVMNTREEIEQTLRELKSGTFARA